MSIFPCICIDVLASMENLPWHALAVCVEVPVKIKQRAQMPHPSEPRHAKRRSPKKNVDVLYDFSAIGINVCAKLRK